MANLIQHVPGRTDLRRKKGLVHTDSFSPALVFPILQLRPLRNSSLCGDKDGADVTTNIDGAASECITHIVNPLRNVISIRTESPDFLGIVGMTSKTNDLLYLTIQPGPPGIFNTIMGKIMPRRGSFDIFSPLQK